METGTQLVFDSSCVPVSPPVPFIVEEGVPITAELNKMMECSDGLCNKFPTNDAVS